MQAQLDPRRWSWPGLRTLLEKPPLWPVLLVGFAVNLWLATLTGHTSDLRQFETWSRDLADGGPFDFYGGEHFKDYLPGYLYFLWFVGVLNEVFTFGPDTYNFVLKLPAVVANMGSAVLLYFYLEDKSRRVRVLAAGTYLLLPTGLFIGPLWGQTDGILAFFILLCAYLLHKRRPEFAAVAFAAATLTKPQAIAALPFFAFWGLREFPPRVWLQASVIAVAAAILIAWPFFPENPFQVVQHAWDATEVFGFHASFTFNFWGLFGWFRDDNQTFYYIDWRYWGLIMTIAADAWIIYSLRNATGPGMLALGIGLCVLSFVVFQTRMHERYMFASFLPLLAACFYLNRKLLWFAFAGLSAMHYLTLYKAFYHPFFNAGDPAFLHYKWLDRMLDYSPSWWHSSGLMTWFLCSLFVLFLTLLLLVVAFLMEHRVQLSPVSSDDERRLGRPHFPP